VGVLCYNHSDASSNQGRGIICSRSGILWKRETKSEDTLGLLQRDWGMGIGVGKYGRSKAGKYIACGADLLLRVKNWGGLRTPKAPEKINEQMGVRMNLGGTAMLAGRRNLQTSSS